MNKRDFYIAVVHSPIYNKNMEIITTAIKNLDIHDIARCARTYDVRKYFIVHPLEGQQTLARRIIDYWTKGYGADYNDDRRQAFSRVDILPTLTEAKNRIEEISGQPPFTVTTDARSYNDVISYRALRKKLADDQRPCLLIFGTGFGIASSSMYEADYILEPIYGPSDYNHLSVRSAASIILDRLRGEAWW